MKLVQKAFATLSSAVKTGSSIGQSYFGLRHVGEYIFQNSNHPGTHAITSVGIFGGLGVNLIVRAPANFRYYCRTVPLQNKEKKPVPLSIPASMIKYLFKTSAHLSGTFTGLNAYFGTIMLSEFIADLTNSDAYDEEWKFYLIQAASLIGAGFAIANFYSYDYGFLADNAEIIAENFEQRHLPLDKNTAKTLALSSFNILSAPVLAYFWTEPALLKITFAKTYIEGTGTFIINVLASSSAFFSTTASLPSIYNSFSNTQAQEIPATPLAKGLLYSTILTGGIDSIASGSCSFIGVVDTAHDLIKIDPYGLILLVAIPCGFSAGANNALFLVRSGFLSLMQDIYPNNNLETAPLLQNEVEDKREKKLSPISYKKNQSVTLYGTIQNSNSFKNISEHALTINDENIIKNAI